MVLRSRGDPLSPSISCALFCTFLALSQNSTFSFQAIPHSFAKNTRGGVPLLSISSLALLRARRLPRPGRGVSALSFPTALFPCPPPLACSLPASVHRCASHAGRNEFQPAVRGEYARLRASLLGRPNITENLRGSLLLRCIRFASQLSPRKVEFFRPSRPHPGKSISASSGSSPSLEAAVQTVLVSGAHFDRLSHSGDVLFLLVPLLRPARPHQSRRSLAVLLASFLFFSRVRSFAR